MRGIASIGLARTVACAGCADGCGVGLPGFEVSNWIGLFAPAGTPPDIVAKLNAEVQKIMRSPDVQKRLEAEGARFIPTTPGQFASFQREELVKWARIIKDANIKAE